MVIERPRMTFHIVPADEAEAIRQGPGTEWFQRLMDGVMLLMPSRPTMSAAMKSRMDLQSFRMRTKSAAPEKEGFYVWFESQKVKDSEFPTDDEVDTANAEMPDDFDPLAEVG